MRTIESIKTPTGVAVTLGAVEVNGKLHSYAMTGPTGKHTLPADTDAKRLAAHWAGFCTMNDVENLAQREASADPKRVAASYRVLRDVERARAALALLEARLDDYRTQAERFDATWAHHGDVAHLLTKLLELYAPDAEAELLAEIDRDLGDLFPQIEES